MLAGAWQWFAEVWRWIGPALIGWTVANPPRWCPSPCCSYEADLAPAEEEVTAELPVVVRS